MTTSPSGVCEIMDLTRLLQLIEEDTAYLRLVDSVAGGGETRAAVLNAAKPYLIAALQQKLRVPLLVVTAHPENAGKLQEQLVNWVGPGVKLFPEPDALPYERIASDTATELERVQVLCTLVHCTPEEAPRVVTSVAAFMSLVPPYQDFAGTCQTVKKDMEAEPFRLLEQWESMGYRLENAVEDPGTISHRGGIVDIYPPTSELPVRVEFFGNTIESLRLFDPSTQRSMRAVTSIIVSPAGALKAGAE